MWQTYKQIKWFSKFVEMNHQMATLHQIRIKVYSGTIAYSWNRLFMDATQMNYWWIIETVLINSCIWWNKPVNQLNVQWVANLDVIHMIVIMVQNKSQQERLQEPILERLLQLHHRLKEQCWGCMDSMAAKQVTRDSYTIRPWPTTSCKIRIVKTNSL